MKRKTIQSAVTAVLLTLAIPAHAERYRVDLIVFTDKTGVGDEAPLPAQAPDLARSLEPTDTAKLRAAGIELVPDENFGLMDQWKKLSNSQRQHPLLRLAWLQKDPPGERGVSLRLRSGALLGTAAGNAGAPVYTVDGTVALLLGRFLHLDADLVYTQTSSAGTLGSYQLKERRRMRRNELHHLDSPRLGLLARVQKADK
ncbi:MAG: hypothetical protein HYZ32_00020 [Hydrocarboniphaga effusa]|nr:hypothetical protein [Hydrocarboniphaga effusa]